MESIMQYLDPCGIFSAATVPNATYDITYYVNKNPNTFIAIIMTICMVCVELFLYAAKTKPDVGKDEEAIDWKFFTMRDELRAGYIKKRKDCLDSASACFVVIVLLCIFVIGLWLLLLRDSESEDDKFMWEYNAGLIEKFGYQLRRLMKNRFWSVGFVVLASLVFDNRVHIVLQRKVYILTRDWFAPRDFEAYWINNRIWVARLWTLVSFVKYAILWCFVYPVVCEHEKARSGFILVFFLFGSDFMTIICPPNVIQGSGRWLCKFGLALFKYVKPYFGLWV